jgi:hypothetical protein
MHVAIVDRLNYTVKAQYMLKVTPKKRALTDEEMQDDKRIDPLFNRSASVSTSSIWDCDHVCFSGKTVSPSLARHARIILPGQACLTPAY